MHDIVDTAVRGLAWFDPSALCLEHSKPEWGGRMW